VCKSSNERPVKIAKSKKRLDILNFSWHWPILNSSDFDGVHACHPLFNDYPQVINARDMEGAF
jgi:hypothetical protein